MTFRKQRPGVWSTRLPRRLLLIGGNHLTLTATEPSGRKRMASTRFVVGARQKGMLTLDVSAPADGSVLATVNSGVEPDLQFKATLNGRAVTKLFQPLLGKTRSARLGTDDGLRQGNNVLRVMAASKAGAYAVTEHLIAVGTIQPLVGAGPAAKTTAGHPVRLIGAYSAGSLLNLSPPAYRWQVVSAPSGSQATPATPKQRSTLFTPDKVGTYQLRLSVGAVYDEVTVLNVPASPPIGIPIDTMVLQGQQLGITIGSDFYPIDYNSDSIQVLVLDATTLEVLYNQEFLGTAADAQTVLTEFKTLQTNAPNTYPLVILSDPTTGNGDVNSAWQQVVQQIGGRSILGVGDLAEGYSIIGVLGGVKGSAWENDGTNPSNDPLPGELRSYLQQDNNGRFTFVPKERVPVDLAVAGASAGQNTIQVGTTAYPSGPLTCMMGGGVGTGGFQVVTLGAETLGPARYPDTAPPNQTFATNGCGGTGDADGVNALSQYLNAIANITGNGNLLVLIQSIGAAPMDPAIPLANLNTALVAVGGTDGVLGYGSYSLIGRALLARAGLPDAYPLAEASSTNPFATQPAHLTGLFKRGRAGVFEPQLVSGSGSVSVDLSLLAFQPPQPNLNSPGELAALEYIAETVLRLAAPNPASSCYVPPHPDVRSEYCNSKYLGSWGSTQYERLEGLAYPGSKKFTKTDWDNVVNWLAPATGYSEFVAVDSLWNFVSLLQGQNKQNPLAVVSWVQSAASQIQESLKSSSSASTAGTWINLIGALVRAVAPFAAPETLAVGLFGNAIAVIADTTNFKNGSSAFGSFSNVTVAEFVTDLTTGSGSLPSAINQIAHLGAIIVTDPIKLQSYYLGPQYSLNLEYSPENAFSLGAAQFAWQSMLPAAYEAVRLTRSPPIGPSPGPNQGVVDATKYECVYAAAPPLDKSYYPFKNAPASAQLLDTKLYVLVQKGAQLPDNNSEIYPPIPKSTLTDPLFQPYNPTSPTIDQFNLFKPWFYREAFGLTNVRDVDC